MNSYGILARFDSPKSLMHAAEKVRDEGFDPLTDEYYQE